LTKAQREELMDFIDKANASRSIEAICDALELHPRAYYRWRAGALSSSHGGGGVKNRITPLEEKRVVALAKKNLDWHCRRIAYQLDQRFSLGKQKWLRL